MGVDTKKYLLGNYSSHNTNHNMKEKIIKILQKAKTHEEAAEKIHLLYNPVGEIDFKSFLEWFNKVTGKKIRNIDQKAKGQLMARLGEGYSKNDIATAVRNCLKDPYHQENRHYLTPEFISRPDKFVKYLYYLPKAVVLPKDWYERELTEAQKGLLTEDQLQQWYSNRTAVELAGGRMKQVIKQ